MRSVAKNILYNKNYYKDEIQNIVNSQFGSSSWSYNSFIDEMVDNTVHDLVITDVTKETTAYTLSVESVTGNFTVGETVVSNNSGEAEVLGMGF